MTCNVQMVNAQTGEIYYSRHLGFAFNVDLPSDVGFRHVLEACKSAAKGARIKQEPIQLRLLFSDVVNSPDLPFVDGDSF